MRLNAWFALSSVVLLGCGDATSPGPLSGQWAQSSTVPGSSLVFTISQDGASLTGTGTYSIEAGAAGTLTVAGTNQVNSVALTLTYDMGLREYFQGQVLGGSMVGTMTDSAGNAFSPTFVRR